MAALAENSSLAVSWHDSAWAGLLNANNVMDYFAQATPFYDRTCNNEIIRMQRLNPEQLNNMTGLEYRLLHVQEPILYVVRKQHRHSPTNATPIASYYIINGFIYQAPDLSSVINSRLLNTTSHLNSAFTEALSYSRYHPSRGYSWQFKDAAHTAGGEESGAAARGREEPSSFFQRQRVDVLLAELANKYPPKYVPAATQTDAAEEAVKEVKTEIKVEKTESGEKRPNSTPVSDVKPPLDKKTKFQR